MKKVLSLILAIVMTALMIPFSAFMISAESNRLFYTDFTEFTPDTGSDGTINDTLPEGYVATVDTDSKWWTSVSAKGITLGGADQGIALTDGANIPSGVLNGTKEHTVKVTFNTDHKFCNIRFGWSGVDAIPTESTVWTSNCIGYVYKGGPTNNYAFSGGLAANGGNIFAVNDATAFDNGSTKYSTDITNVNTGTKTSLVEARGAFQAKAIAGDIFTFSFEISDGVVKTVYIESGEEIFSFSPATTVTAKGYFSVWLTNWGVSNNTANIKSIEILSGAYQTPESSPESPEVLHNASFANITSTEQLPYDIFLDETINGKLWLSNGILYNSESISSGTAWSNTFQIDQELFNSLSSYTLELTLAGGSDSRIFYLHSGCNDDPSSKKGYGADDTSAFKLRLTKNLSSGAYQSGTDAWSNAILKSDNTYAWAYNSNSPERMSSAIESNILAGKDIDLKIMVEDGLFVAAYISCGGETVLSVPTERTDALAGDLGFYQNATSQFGLKRIKITADAVYGDTPEVTENLLSPEGTVAIRSFNIADVIDADEITSEEIVAIKENGEYKSFSSSIEIKARSVYDVILTSTFSKMILTANKPELRLASNPGIRFKTGFSSYDFDLIYKLMDCGIIRAVNIGTLITLDSHAQKLNMITIEELKAYGDAENKKVYLNVAADAGDLYAENTFAGSIISLKSHSKDYVGVGYISVTFANGMTSTAYADNAKTSAESLALEITEDKDVFNAYSSVEQKALEYMSLNKLFADAPKYQGGGDIEIYRGFEPSGLHYLIISGATKDDFEEYTELLAEDGYTRTRRTSAGVNIFETWTNGYTILTMSHIYYVDPATNDRVQQSASIGDVKYMSISIETVETTSIPTVERDIEDITTEQITTVGTSCGYVLRLSDGRFVVFDGGLSNAASLVYDIIVEQNARQGKPVIAAWYITHFHSDHVGAANEFMKKYSNAVDIQSFVHHLPGDEIYIDKNTAEGIPNDEDINMKNRGITFYERINTLYPNAKIIVAHAGQRFEFGDIDIDVLWTSELHYGKQMIDTNQSSVLYSITGASGRMIILGDQQERGCAMLNAIYGNTLKCDLVQVSHHGHNGGDEDMYASMAAKYAIWTNSVESIKANSLHYNPSYGRNLFDYTTVEYNLAPSENDEPIILYEGMTKEDIAKLDIGLTH